MGSMGNKIFRTHGSLFGEFKFICEGEGLLPGGLHSWVQSGIFILKN